MIICFFFHFIFGRFVGRMAIDGTFHGKYDCRDQIRILHCVSRSTGFARIYTRPKGTFERKYITMFGVFDFIEHELTDLIGR